MGGRIGELVGAVVGAAVVAACGGSAGEATNRSTGVAPGPAATSTVGPSDPVRFDEGVTLIESRRLAAVVPRVDVIDREFTHSCLPLYPARDAESLGVWFGEEQVKTLRVHGFVAAYLHCVQNGGQNVRGLRTAFTAAVEMRDEASARDAVRDLVPTLKAGLRDSIVEPLPAIDGATAALGTDSEGRHQLEVVVPHGRLVLYQSIDDAAAARLVSTATQTLQVALDRADDFTPTPLEAMDDLVEDPRDLRRLVYTPSQASGPSGGAYDPDAYWGVGIDPDLEGTLLDEAGFRGHYHQMVENRESYAVFELRDAAAGRVVLAGFDLIERRAHPDLSALSVPGLPSPGNCYAFTAGGDVPVQRCYFVHDKYLWQVAAFRFGVGLTDLRPIRQALARQLAVAPR